MGRVTSFLFVVVCLLASSGVAKAQTCSPPCREGFTCVNGSCVALCNPPCPAGEVCVEGRFCEPVQTVCNPACREGFTCSNGRCVSTSTGPATPTQPTPVQTEPAPGTDASVGEVTGAMSPLTTLLKLRFGFGGEADGEAEGFDLTDDLITTIGVGVEQDWMIRADQIGVSVGAMLSGLWWNTELGDDADNGRNTLIEGSVVPKVSYRIQPSLFVYAAVPVGISLNFFNSDNLDDAGVGFGWHISVLAGLQYASDLVGVFVEMGVDVHNFSHTVDVAGGEVDLDINMTQFGLNLGLAF